MWEDGGVCSLPGSSLLHRPIASSGSDMEAAEAAEAAQEMMDTPLLLLLLLPA